MFAKLASGRVLQEREPGYSSSPASKLMSRRKHHHYNGGNMMDREFTSEVDPNAGCRFGADRA